MVKENLRNILSNSIQYNLKRKSDWINEAIVMLKDNPDYVEMVCHAEGRNNDFVFDKIYMTFYQRCYFAEMRNHVVKSQPDIKGPQGAIIRAAVLSRLMRDNLLI